MSEKNDEIWDAAARYIEGDLQPGDKEKLDMWSSESEVNRRSFQLFLSVRFRKRQELSFHERNQIIYNTFYKINSERNRSVMKMRYALAAAASLVIIIVSSVLFYHLGESGVKQQLVEMYTPKGMRSKIILPDGSLVELNSDSKISYPVKFNSRARQVSLEGEAFFTVTKDKKHPFIVKAGNIDIRVLGTRFNVKAYGEESQIETTLEEGVVTVLSGNSKSDTLAPNQQAVWDNQSKTLRVYNVDYKLYSGWRDGKYYFKAKTFDEIARTLERVFNVTIEIRSEKLKKEVFTGDFEQGENLEHILSIIALSTRINYRIKGQNVIITEK